MRLFLTLGAGFTVAFGVGLVFGFSYQTDWIAGLVISCAAYISIQVDEFYLLVYSDISKRAADRHN